MKTLVTRHLSLVTALAALAASADPALPPPPDAVIRIAGVSAATNAVATLAGHLGRPAVPAERLPYPGQMARLAEHVLGDALADEPAHLLVWLPESADGSAPFSVLWMLPVRDAAPDAPGTPWTKPFGSGMVVRRDRLLMLAMDEPRAWFAAGDGPERAVESARFEPDGAVLQAVLREPARFAGLRDGMLAKRKEFHADAARLRERAAAGEDVEDELRWAGHMEEHAVFEEAIGDLVFSLLDATDSTRLSLDCDNVHGLVFTRVLDGIGPPEDFPAERIPLSSFLAENLPFLAEAPESEDVVLCGETWVGPDGVAAVGTRTDLWMFPPATLRALLPTLQSLAPTHIGPPEPAKPAAAAPASARRPPDRDRPDGADTDSDGLPDSVELEKWNTDPDNPDTDADGLRDGDEATKYHTDPCNPDTDADGLRDGDEVNKYLTDPLNADTDGDGVWDGAEILKHKTNPLNPDTDGDGVQDGAEIEAGTNPLLHAEGVLPGGGAGKSEPHPVEPHAESAEGAEGAPLPFSVKFRRSHPFLAEYDRWIVFPSGKRIGIWPDTGGAGAFAVYRLASGAYYLIDGLEFEYARSEYRVDPAAETAEIMNGTRWIAIPDGAEAVVGSSSESIAVKTKQGETTVGGGVPVGDSLEGRTYLGLVKPDGRFKPGTGDPYAAHVDPPWTVVALPDAVPFRLELFAHRKNSARVVFPDGKTRILTPLFRTEVFELHALDGGAFLLVRPSEVEWNVAKYRVDPGKETLEVLHADAWFEIPEEATGISGFSKTRGTPRRVVMTIETADGKKDVERSTPAGNPPERTTFLGTIHPDGSFTPAATPNPHAEGAEKKPHAESAEPAE